MEVELFDVLEAEDTAPEACERAKELCESLGLKGQARFHGGAVDAPRMPYRVLTEEESFVYGELCPKRTEAESYMSGPIPLRVLEAFERAKRCEAFTKFEVWHPKDMTLKDPVLVGYAPTDPEHSWTSMPHIIARWGEVLDSMPTMLAEAANRYRARMLGEARTTVIEINGFIERLGAATDAGSVVAFRQKFFHVHLSSS